MNGISDWHLYGLFALFSTFSVYNAQRLFKSGHPTETPWLSWVQRNEKSLYLATFASGLAMLSCMLWIGKISFGSIILLLASGIVSLLYVIPIYGVVIREIPYIKIYLIAFTWAVVLILFPILNEGKLGWTAVLHAIAIALFVISAAIPFDIRDVKFDTDSHKTIPQIIGVGPAKWVSIVLLMSFLAIMFLSSPQLLVSSAFYAAVAVQFALLLFMNERRGDLYCAGAIDGAIGLIGLSYFFT